MSTAASNSPIQSVDSNHSCKKAVSDKKQVLACDFFLPEVITPPTVTASFDAQPEKSESENACVTNSNKDFLGLEVGAVMDADSLPALFKSVMSDGSSSSQELAGTNHEAPSRQCSTELGGDSLNHNIATANGSFSQEPYSHGYVVEESRLDLVKSSSSAIGSPRNNTHRDVGQRGGTYVRRELHQPRGSFRRNNSGPQLQGNGSFNPSNGSRRDEHESNANRSFGGRVNLAPQQRVTSTPFIHGPISNAPFIYHAPPPVAVWPPYGPPMFYNDMPSMSYAPGPHPCSLGHMPMFPFPPVFYSRPDPHLPSKIVRQIDYYFSNENLVKDTFLRQKMDVDGWVPINLIANFNKIRALTDNVQIILDALRASNLVEIQGEKVRRKDNWKKWVLPPNLSYG